MIKEVKLEHWNATVAVKVMYENILEMMREKNLSGELVQFNENVSSDIDEIRLVDSDGFGILENGVCFLLVEEYYTSHGSWHTHKEITVYFREPNKNADDYCKAIMLVPCTYEDFYRIVGKIKRRGRSSDDDSSDRLRNGDKVVCHMKNGKNLHCVFVEGEEEEYFVDINACRYFGEGVEVRVKPVSWEKEAI